MLERLPAGHAHQRDAGGPPGKLSEAARLWALGLFAADDEASEAAAQAAAQRRARILAQAGVREVDATGAPVEHRRRSSEPVFWLWPAGERTWRLWLEVQTQWRTGMAGATGLDYAAVWAVIDRRMPRRQREDAFQALQAMERSALAAWAERRADQESNRND